MKKSSIITAVFCAVFAACHTSHTVSPVSQNQPATESQMAAPSVSDQNGTNRRSAEHDSNEALAQSTKSFDRAVLKKDVFVTKEKTYGWAAGPNSRTCPTVLSYYYPTQPNTEAYDVINESGFHTVTVDPLSTFSVDVDAASYANMRRFLSNNQLPPKDAVRIEEMINYFDYDYPQPNGEHPFSITTEIAGCPWAPEHKLLLVGLQGKKVDASHMPPSNLVFLIDVSGSMQSEDKLPLLKSSLHLLVKQLRPQDKISMVVYAGSAGLVLPSTRGHQKATILAAVDRLEAGGSTAGGAGIQLAYNVAKENFIHGGINRVILATDGDFNVGVSNDEELVKIIEEKRQTGVSLSVLGFGTGNLKDSRMEKLADKGNGNYSYIDGLLEAKKVLVSQISGTLNTIAKDVKIQVEFNPSHVQAYRLIGYENRVLNKEDFNNDKKDAGEIGAGHEVTALYEVVPMGAAMDNTVDPLKYQKPQIVEEPSTRYTDEIATVKFRYKKPDGDKSILLTHVVTRESYRRWVPSGNITFATAVAGFGMLLRNSEYTGALRYGDVIALAKSAIGPDENGNRAEFVKLVRTADVLAETTSASLGVIRE